MWLLVCTALVFFMQAGFCCLEAGSVRSKNSVNVALKNVTDFLVASFCFYAIGYSLMFGVSSLGGFIGKANPFLSEMGNAETFTFLYQLVFCGTTATIVSGAMAERLRFLPYILASAGLAIVIYPVYGHWVWSSDGWLTGMGFHDFAGSSVVHMVGGVVALSGIRKLGPRKGRFTPDGPRDIHGSDLPMVALGTFILFFGWIGFNGGSAPFGEATGLIVLNTVVGGIFGGMSCLLVGWALRGINGAATIMNGTLAGLVAITAGADVVTPHSAAVIGCGGGLAFYLVDALLLRLKLDDAVGAVPVHAAAGAAGILMTALVARPDYLIQTSVDLGRDFSRLDFFMAQGLGVVVCFFWSFILGSLLWMVIGKISQLRVTETEELIGLNYSEHLVKSPVDEIISYVSSRKARLAGSTLHSEGESRIVKPVDLEGGEFARILEVMETWSVSLEKEREEVEQVRTWLNQDSDRLYEIIQTCQRENTGQAKLLEALVAKLERVQHALAFGVSAANFSAQVALAGDVLESAREKLAEMQAGHGQMSYYWEQLRHLSSTLFRNTRTLTKSAPV